MITIRTFAKPDFPRVQIIYKEGIDTGNATFETQLKDWEKWNNSTLSTCRLVAEMNEKVVGWGALSPVSDRCVYEGVAEVSLYISMSYNGQGFGTALLKELVATSETAGIWTLQAGIFPENKASISIHKKNGFVILGTRKKIGKLKSIWRDVVLMERRSAVVGI